MIRRYYFCCRYTHLNLKILMKNLAILFSTLALLGVIALFGLRMSDKPSKNDTKETTKEQITDTKGRVAFVNIDSLQEQYEYFATEKKKFEARQESMVKELESSSQKFQQDLMAAQRKAEANAMTQAEYESTAKKLDQMRMRLELLCRDTNGNYRCCSNCVCKIFRILFPCTEPD